MHAFITYKSASKRMKKIAARISTKMRCPMPRTTSPISRLSLLDFGRLDLSIGGRRHGHARRWSGDEVIIMLETNYREESEA
jgi:hypothetical protein